jgi:hypothetical protein
MQGLILIATFPLSGAVFAADGKPLTEEQIKQVSKDLLKNDPEGVMKMVESHGVSFFPTKTNLGKLKEAGVSQAVIEAIRRKAGSQMRIKVCLFKGPNQDLAKEFADAMVRSVVGAKGAEIEPFGRIPLDRTIGPPEGFDKDVKAEANTLYILIEGWIGSSASPLSLETRVIYQDVEGKQYVLPGAKDAPSALSRRRLEDDADDVVNWAIRTAQEYANK